jgi:argininosuccinate synthase
MEKIVLAFSGGLDTSFCAIWLKEKTGAEIVTVTVDTGGFGPGEIARVEARSREIGVREHRTIDARKAVYDRFVSYLIKGNCLRGGVYPMCVGAERTVQAETVVHAAQDAGAKGIAHGSTGAGNDQVRFDVAIRALDPRFEIHAPVRDLNWTREQETKYLAERGVHVPPKTVAYSVNVGLFGTTIGGKETHDTWKMPPEDVYTMTVAPEAARAEPEEVVITFAAGLPVALDGKKMDGVTLLAALNERGRPHGVGRGVHVGDTILGLKGRLAFEAPGPLILIKAHRELEKLVQTRWQAHWREQAGSFYGSFLHEGLYYDPVMRDLEALLDSANARVEGDVRVRMWRGNYDVVGTRSKQSLFDAGVATYGEGAKAWTGADAQGFSRIYGVPSMLAAMRDRRNPS